MPQALSRPTRSLFIQPAGNGSDDLTAVPHDEVGIRRHFSQSDRRFIAAIAVSNAGVDCQVLLDVAARLAVDIGDGMTIR
jgi:hypothetical protein